jgi:hypothetical protein
MIDNPALQVFAQYTPEQKLTPGYGDTYDFYVGHDNVHGILLWLLTNEKKQFKGNMFGFDDQELNDAILAMFKIPSIHVQLSLDKSQAGGVHEAAILKADQAQDPADFANSFTILQSATHQISHTKGGTLASLGLFFNGSTNWSSSGEGTGISLKADIKNPPGYKAQNNTLTVSANPVRLNLFNVELDVEHNAGLKAKVV